MLNTEKRLYMFLILLDALLIIISMVSGPLNRTALSIGCAASAIIISVSLVAYGILMWKRR